MNEIRCLPLDDLSLTVDEELVKVPGHSLPTRLVLEIFVKRNSIVTVHVDLVKDREGDLVLSGAEFLDLLIAAGLLPQLPFSLLQYRFLSVALLS